MISHLLQKIFSSIHTLHDSLYLRKENDFFQKEINESKSISTISSTSENYLMIVFKLSLYSKFLNNKF